MAWTILGLLALLAALIVGEWHASFFLGHFYPFAAEWSWSSLLHLKNYAGMIAMPYQVRVLEHVLAHAKQDDPADVVTKVDEFGWAWPSMNVGDVKGPIVDKALADMGTSVKVAVEFGSYMGYSTVRLGAVLKRTSPQAVLYSVDPHPLGHAVKLAMLDRAGLLGPGVRNELAYSTSVLHQLAAEGRQVDFLFLDHIKDLYLPDAQLALDLGLLRKGSVIVADNVISPGAPDYRKWMLGNSRFETKVHLTKLEYSKVTPDEVLVSTFLG